MRVARRVAQYALVLWAAATLNFALPHLAPGDPVVYVYGGDAQALSEENLQTLRATFGLDRPLIEQYGAFWAGLVRGDLGLSVQHNRPVVEVLAERLPWTLALVGTATVLAAVLGTLLGAWAAWRADRGRGDSGTLTGMLTLDAMPGFWVGMILVAVFAVQLGWFPSYGAVTITGEGAAWLGEVLARLVLPVATLVVTGMGAFFLLARASMSGVLHEAFVTRARAAGLSERRVALGHALRTALLPVTTSLAVAVGTMLSGAVVVESVFAYPGLGKLIFDAVTVRDYPLLQGAFLLTTVGVVAANVAADLAYPLLDPRVRRGPVEVSG
ncbi:ABC transporter permease [Pseudonocardia saturnea]